MTNRGTRTVLLWTTALSFAIGSSVLLPVELLAKPRGRLQNTDHRGHADTALSTDSAGRGQESRFCEIDEHNGCYINAAQPIGTECECVDGQGNSYDGQIAE